MEISILKVKVTYTEQALAVSPGDLNILKTHILKNAPEAAEEEAKAMEYTLEQIEELVDEKQQQQSTIFFRDELGLYWWLPVQGVL